MHKARYLKVGGLVPLSTTDYPDRLSAVIFCQGCSWRCGYCHNPHLLPKHGVQEIAWLEILAFLERRRGLLDAVVFSGGEPTLQAALPDAMREVRAMGYEIGLHTAGIHPRRLRAVLPLADWIGMDIKTSFDEYACVTGVAGSGARAKQSMALIVASGIDHEFRTTVQAARLSAPQLLALARDLAASGVRHYVLQECRETAAASRPRGLSDALCHALRGVFPALAVRCA